jgi:orotidine-5'-phosphate decarboxylase
MNFYTRLKNAINSKGSYVCVGLDSDIDRLPLCVKGNTVERIISFNRAVIKSTSNFCAAYKFNVAFYEALGRDGYIALEESMSIVPNGHIIILDAKRGDIGNTSIKYSHALFDRLGADAITANPYMGYDSLGPFIEREEKGVFILCLTSNKGSGDFQQLRLKSGRRLYEDVAAKIAKWNILGNLGLVVGATHSKELATIRRIVAEMPILIPGIGAQKGDLEKTVSIAIGKERLLALINSSRGIIFASNGEDFAEKAGEKCKEMCNAIKSML